MPSYLSAFPNRLLAVIGTAMILQFYSEFYFLNEGPALAVSTRPSALPGLIEGIAIYGLFAYIFLIVIDRFAIHNLAGLVLAGSIFGWATEALVVPVVYEAPPVSWIWPSVSWHALVDVIGGWYLLRVAMRRLSWPWLALLLAGLGMVWALWASWTWGAQDEAPTIYTTGQFWNIALVSGATWVVGTVLADIGARRRFRASVWEASIVGLAAVALFAGTGAAFLPWSAGLAFLIALTFAVLALARRDRRDAPGLLAPLASAPPVSAYVVLPVLPLVAGISYPVVLARGLAVPTEEIVPLFLIAGGSAFLWALVRVALDARQGRTPDFAP